MKAARSKANRKVMALYTSTYNFRQPYQVLVDSDFCRTTVSQKLEAQARLEKLLGGPVKLMVTQCCVQHLYAGGAKDQVAVLFARSCERRKCNHWEVKDTDHECISGLIGDDNRYRYVVATQSYRLRSSLRKVPGVPVVYINPRSVLLLEPPSEITISVRQKIEESKLHAAPSEASGNVVQPEASTLTAATISSRLTVEQVLGKRKRPAKGPNPLSVKKKLKKPKPSAEPRPPKTELPKRGTEKELKGGDKAPVPPAKPLGERQTAINRVGRDIAASNSKRKRKRGRRRIDANSDDACD